MPPWRVRHGIELPGYPRLIPMIFVVLIIASRSFPSEARVLTPGGQVTAPVPQPRAMPAQAWRVVVITGNWRSIMGLPISTLIR